MLNGAQLVRRKCNGPPRRNQFGVRVQETGGI